MVLPSGAQFKMITSPDGKSRIISQSIGYRDGLGSYCLEGVVKNISSEPEINVRIKIEYYDANGMSIDIEEDVVTVLKPGGTRAFYIPYAGLRRGDVKSHKIDLI